MYHHTPPNYVCPFCLLAKGQTHPDLETHTDDIFYQNEHITAFIASRWWPNNPGHALIVPNTHIENIYELVPEIAVHVHEAARQTAIAFKEVYGAEGTSTRQHNEPAGYQEVFHYHLHVFPRYTNDYLYDLTFQRRKTTREERTVYAEKLRRWFATRT
jgi:histidine triad (HIT) family protein